MKSEGAYTLTHPEKPITKATDTDQDLRKANLAVAYELVTKSSSKTS